MQSDVGVVIVNWNGRQYLDGCLGSIRAYSSIVIVDNGSTDGSVEWVRAHHPGVQVIEMSRNVGFSAGNNIGSRACSRPYLLFLNNDTIVAPGAIEWLRAAFDSSPSIGIVGARLEQPNGEPQIGSIGQPPTFQREMARLLRLRSVGTAGNDNFDYDSSQFCDMVCGAALMIRRDLLEGLGGWPEEYFAYAEDADLCRTALRAGHLIWYESRAKVLHYHGGSGRRGGKWKAVRAAYIGHRSINLYIRRHEGAGRALLHAAMLPVGLALGGLRRIARRVARQSP